MSRELTDKLVRGETLVPFLTKWIYQARTSEGSHALESRLEQEALRMMQEDQNYTDNVMGDKKSYYDDWIHLSRLGGCLAENYFSLMKFTKITLGHGSPFKEWAVFGNGSYTHLRWQTLLSVSGILKAREDTASFCREDYKIRGKADGIILLEDERSLFELKSINSRGFSEVKRTGVPKREHAIQATGYMFFLGLKKAYIVYEEKDSHKTLEFKINFSEEFFDKNVFQRVYHLENAMKNNFVPERENASKNKDGSYSPTRNCSFCPFQHVCFSPDKVLIDAAQDDKHPFRTQKDEHAQTKAQIKFSQEADRRVLGSRDFRATSECATEPTKGSPKKISRNTNKSGQSAFRSKATSLKADRD